jgi:hypothetical protein
MLHINNLSVGILRYTTPHNIMLLCEDLARAGDLEGLKRARGNGCPWNEKTCSTVTQEGYVLGNERTC